MKKIYKVLLVASLVLCLMGCGNDDNKEIKAGYDCVVTQDYSTALIHFQQAIDDGTDIENAYRGMGLAYMGRGEYGKAINAFNSALSYAGLFPGKLEIDINYYMATAYYKIGEYDKAIEIYDSIIAFSPKDIDSYYLRGSMKLNLGDLDGARSDFDQAVKLSKNDFNLCIDIYAEMLNTGYGEAGQTYLDIVLSGGYMDDISAYNKGRLCYYQGEYSQAINFLERAKKDDASMDVIILLSECYKLNGQYDYAAVIYNSYLANEENPEIYNQLGLCYVEQGDYESALQAFQSGIAVKVNNTCLQTLYLNEIACYEYMHDYRTAREKLDEYLAVYPSTPLLEKERAFLATR